MKKIKLLAVIALTLLCSSGSISALTDSTSSHRNEMSLDIAPFLTRAFSPASATFLYRYHCCASSALRVRLDVSAGNNSGTSDQTGNAAGDTTNSTSKDNNLNLSLRLGYQHFFNTGRAQFYMGADALVTYVNYDNTSSSINKRSLETYTTTAENKGNTTGFGIAPIMGVQYRMGRYFSIGIEEYLSLMYTNNKRTYTQDQHYTYTNGMPDTDNTTKTESTNKGTNLTLNPVNNLSIYICFRF